MGIKWQDNGYEVVITADGSPSLRSLSIPTLESMHHSGGALSETESIYTPVFRQVLELIPQARFFSLGLGLGYNEWIWARECLLSGYGSAETAQGPGSAAIPIRRSSLVTVESQDFLSQTFLKHLRSQEFSQEHQDLLERICNKPSIQESCKKDILPTNVEESPREIQEKTLPQQLNQFLSDASQVADWVLSGALDASWVNSYRGESFHGILYDAFSAKTCPDLWSEEFLTLFLQKLAAPDCVFSTYASRGGLRRTLVQQGFRVFLRQGFQGKRQSTYAVRGRFADPTFLTDIQKVHRP